MTQNSSTKLSNAARIGINFLVLTAIFIASHFLVELTKISKITLFDTSNLFTYFGVLIGFALTIYTFGLTTIPSIKNGIDCIDEKVMAKETKKEVFEQTISGFSQIKEDILVIFFSIIIIVVTAICKDTINPFGWKVQNWKVPEKVNLTLFFYSTLCIYDIIKSMFNLAEINLKLLK
jgi:hypothetical protein